MLLCTFAWEKGLLICGAAAGATGGATVCAVCASITELQSSPSTAAIMFSLREINKCTHEHSHSALYNTEVSHAYHTDLATVGYDENATLAALGGYPAR